MLLDIPYQMEMEKFEEKLRKKHREKESEHRVATIETIEQYREREKREEDERKKEREIERKMKEDTERIIRNKYKKIPDLEELQNWLQKNKQRSGQMFYSQHFDSSNEENQDLKEKKMEQRNIKNKINMIKYATVAMLVMALSGYRFYDIQKQKKVESMTKEVMKDIFKDKDVGDYADMH